MDAVLLDTDVFSFFFKRDTRRELYAAAVANRQLCVAFMTVAELKRWAIERNWSAKRREELEQVLKHYVVLPYDADMAEAWAQAAVACKRTGREIACGDCWIAAAALRHGIPLLTHNGKHFRTVPGLNIVSKAPDTPAGGAA
jgi:tRNA(fMet)-specific endonuclease VapC